MKKLYYATFEKGFDTIVEKYIKKMDRESYIKKIYADSVIFYANEHISFFNNLFLSAYLVLDNTIIAGDGAINKEMKHLLEKKDFYLKLPKEVKKIKLSYLYSNKKMKVDSKLKVAFETMLAKKTGKQLGFFNTELEFAIIVKDDGECLFAKNLIFIENFSGLRTNKNELSPQTAFALNFLSNPNEGEVVLDPFSKYGTIPYVRALCFKKANVIANEKNSENIIEIKKKAKHLKEKSFSVMNYDFLDNAFPIKFIDKIVTELPDDMLIQKSFIEKIANLKVKTVVILTSKFSQLNFYIRGLYEIIEDFDTIKGRIFKLQILN